MINRCSIIILSGFKMRCLSCDEETKNPKFCSSSCSAKFTNRNRKRSIESRIKTSASLRKDKANPSKIECLVCKKQFYKFESAGKKYCSRKCYRRLKADFSLNGKGSHKKILLLERGHKCERCKNEIWLGVPISLQLEHKDGNHFNNTKDNLELLCPNCHSQTPTYNRRKTAVMISDLDFLLALKNSKSIYECLCNLGLNSSSTNYKRAKRLLNQI